MTNSKNKIEEFIRVDHAGERGAVKIYEGQLLALNTLIKNESLKKTIEEMKIHEKEHCDFLKMRLKKEILVPQNFFLYGICLALVWGLVQLYLEKKLLCYVQLLLKK